MRFFWIIVLTIALAFSSCNNDSTNPTDNIDSSPKSATIKTSAGDLEFKTGTGSFETLHKNTTLSFTNYVPTGNQDTAGYSMTIKFKGNATGYFSYNDDNQITIMKENVVYESMYSVGKINVLKYDTVGQTIEGTFTGQFKNQSGGGSFSVTSASFKAIRLADERDEEEEPIIDTLVSYMEVKMTTVQGVNFNYLDDKLDGVAHYDEEKETLSLIISCRDEDYETHALMIYIYSKYIKKRDNQAIYFEDTKDAFMELFYYLDPHNLIGSARITKFAHNVGDMFEITGSGEIFEIPFDHKRGDVQYFKVKVLRKT
ncbi:MAG: hypothetical protein CVV22_08145 [Ignavibacteriae bacterium HGW-Ignavibacteriae-1]|jgi:hypothetical protein|nr:MAG: hypothetical protein CVV22_08145 [Ignavibacteriae bacterium HGW-Ignavibacteriae-1]